MLRAQLATVDDKAPDQLKLPEGAHVKNVALLPIIFVSAFGCGSVSGCTQEEMNQSAALLAIASSTQQKNPAEARRLRNVALQFSKQADQARATQRILDRNRPSDCIRSTLEDDVYENTCNVSVNIGYYAFFGDSFSPTSWSMSPGKLKLGAGANEYPYIVACFEKLRTVAYATGQNESNGKKFDSHYYVCDSTGENDQLHP
ncbi:hypothetical protein AB6802_25235 [Mesorhizobium sp. RCC_202]|uniref:hypothetical protein n=1 Tax=Mesorhizobium sp. RCC_202 TaxID=3239222 RepID=UPI003525D362